MPEIIKYTIPGANPLPDNAQWTNRFEIKSESSRNIYIVAQNKATSLFGCSCPGYRTHRKCKHLTALKSLGIRTPAQLLGSGSSTITPKPFTMNYNQYSAAERAGSVAEWTKAFNTRLGLDEAKRIVGANSPRGILGVTATATWTEIKTAYRNLVRQCHPDLNPEYTADPSKFRKIQAAYEVLEAEQQDKA